MSGKLVDSFLSGSLRSTRYSQITSWDLLIPRRPLVALCEEALLQAQCPQPFLCQDTGRSLEQDWMWKILDSDVLSLDEMRWQRILLMSLGEQECHLRFSRPWGYWLELASIRAKPGFTFTYVVQQWWLCLCGSERNWTERKIQWWEASFSYQQQRLPNTSIQRGEEDWEEMEKIEKENIGDFLSNSKMEENITFSVSCWVDKMYCNVAVRIRFLCIRQAFNYMVKEYIKMLM